MQEVVLVRIYGHKTELFVDRENEVKSSPCAPGAPLRPSPLLHLQQRPLLRVPAGHRPRTRAHPQPLHLQVPSPLPRGVLCFPALRSRPLPAEPEWRIAGSVVSSWVLCCFYSNYLQALLQLLPHHPVYCINSRGCGPYLDLYGLTFLFVCTCQCSEYAWLAFIYWVKKIELEFLLNMLDQCHGVGCILKLPVPHFSVWFCWLACDCWQNTGRWNFRSKGRRRVISWRLVILVNWCVSVSLTFRQIARQLAKYHAIHAHNGWMPRSDLWLKMGKYFSLVPTHFQDPAQNLR